ncbi:MULTISPECIES: MBL fold metallo-hydrolase [unclassified Curtobacterium]|uniref:MBL fold metallo-hydrolase n=1 Tax=unclassified Curtobacterium TaxID=257496 RepID=UPI000DA92BA2|nr:MULTISPECIES: MBL fold metallo-hydrolase [unclassified Curtobacterium]PZE27979.1 MBL fold metallo-hydrolase [Curtobacterium sp. MCBD17_028]PZE78259.1 MBL fold metallo-hydrolase [Curtobacterium sp. MCBD17_019]PZF62421.1 MBL fold metallo-hydrolase [Curtobacterium sp. MCBD17_034]PZM39873.1 MBL fold metallo-hydrolase [Curtobacterium sp. MCBD17_031]WIB67888.1 MBL fold metallo-hydrolase [Curtobacterium sp. MCBD17_035]
MLFRDVAEGIHRLEIAHTNLYLVETGDQLLVVDSGLPAAWPHLLVAIAELGYTPDAVEGIALTHGHFDHVGTAARARREWDVPVLVHPRDAELAAHPYRYRTERNRLVYPLTHPAGLPKLARMVVAGALMVEGVTDTKPLDERDAVQASPWIIETPGHTDGHVALYFADRDALIAGDAIVTLDPYTGGIGPQIVAGSATADSGAALESLDRLVDTEARIVLPGHGPQWRRGIRSAVEQAKRRSAH